MKAKDLLCTRCGTPCGSLMRTVGPQLSAWVCPCYYVNIRAFSVDAEPPSTREEPHG